MDPWEELMAQGKYFAALKAAGPAALNPTRPLLQRVKAALVATRAAAAMGMYPQARRYATIALEQAPTRELLAQALHDLSAVLTHLQLPAGADIALLAGLARTEAIGFRHVRPAGERRRRRHRRGWIRRYWYVPALTAGLLTAIFLLR